MPKEWTGKEERQYEHIRGPRGLTRDQLYNEAEQRNIKGRSSMSKTQLAHALGRD
ncbi:hypothetical protein [Nocardia sp. NPDC059239]|uniref:hypothetical protein n=1 Tax=unclassified Nocardia TaxID=2637762 RepID=UPI003696BE0D